MPTMTYGLMHSSLTITQFLSAFGIGTILGIIIIYFVVKHS